MPLTLDYILGKTSPAIRMKRKMTLEQKMRAWAIERSVLALPENPIEKNLLLSWQDSFIMEGDQTRKVNQHLTALLSSSVDEEKKSANTFSLAKLYQTYTKLINDPEEKISVDAEAILTLMTDTLMTDMIFNPLSIDPKIKIILQLAQLHKTSDTSDPELTLLFSKCKTASTLSEYNNPEEEALANLYYKSIEWYVLSFGIQEYLHNRAVLERGKKSVPPFVYPLSAFHTFVMLGGNIEITPTFRDATGNRFTNLVFSFLNGVGGGIEGIGEGSGMIARGICSLIDKCVNEKNSYRAIGMKSISSLAFAAIESACWLGAKPLYFFANLSSPEYVKTSCGFSSKRHTMTLKKPALTSSTPSTPEPAKKITPTFSSTNRLITISPQESKNVAQTSFHSLETVAIETNKKESFSEAKYADKKIAVYAESFSMQRTAELVASLPGALNIAPSYRHQRNKALFFNDSKVTPFCGRPSLKIAVKGKEEEEVVSSGMQL